MSRASMLGLLAAGSVAAMACLGTTPQEREREALGDYEDGDEFHRPGQPCLTCHREDFTPGEEVFQAAGTVYLTPTSADGLRGVTVEVTDAEGRVATATTNRVGNFMFGEDDESSRRAGYTNVRYRFAYPLRIRIQYLEVEQVMNSVSWRQGACADCHALDGPHGAAEPRVYVMEVGP